MHHANQNALNIAAIIMLYYPDIKKLIIVPTFGTILKFFFDHLKYAKHLQLFHGAVGRGTASCGLRNSIYFARPFVIH